MVFEKTHISVTPLSRSSSFPPLRDIYIPWEDRPQTLGPISTTMLVIIVHFLVVLAVMMVVIVVVFVMLTMTMTMMMIMMLMMRMLLVSKPMGVLMNGYK